MLFCLCWYVLEHLSSTFRVLHAAFVADSCAPGRKRYFPPTVDMLIAWSSLFQCADTWANYLNYVRTACLLVKAPTQVLATRRVLAKHDMSACGFRSSITRHSERPRRASEDRGSLRAGRGGSYNSKGLVFHGVALCMMLWQEDSRRHVATGRPTSRSQHVRQALPLCVRLSPQSPVRGSASSCRWSRLGGRAGSVDAGGGCVGPSPQSPQKQARRQHPEEALLVFIVC